MPDGTPRHHVALFVALVCAGGPARAGDWERHPRSLAVAPDGVAVAAAGGDRVVRIWDTTDGTLLHRLALDNPGHSVTYVGRGGDLAVGDDGGKGSAVTLWRCRDGRYTRASRTRVCGTVAGVAASPDGRWVAAATVYGHVYFIDAADGAVRRAWQEAGNGIRDAAFSPDGRTLYTAGQDFRAWDVRADELPGRTATVRDIVPADERERDERRYLRGRAGCANLVAPLPGDGGVIAVGWFANRRGTSSDLMRFEGLRWEKRTALSDAMGDATFVAVAPDGQTLAVGFNGGRVEVWDVTAGRKAAVTLEGIGQLRAGAFLGDGKRLVVADDGSARVEVVDALTGKVERVLPR